MNEQIAARTKEIMIAALKSEVPDEFRITMQDGVAQLRGAMAKWNEGAKNGARAVEEIVASAQAGTRTICDQIMTNLQQNSEAILNAAHALANAKTLPECAHLQTTFMQSQMSAIAKQTNELVELSTKISRETSETLAGIASKVAANA